MKLMSNTGSQPIIGFLGFFSILLIGTNALLLWVVLQKQNEPSTYTSCLENNGQILKELYPQTCVTKSGMVFIKPLTPEELQKLHPSQYVSPAPTLPKPAAKDGCKVSGCSNELCLENNNNDSSVCDAKPYYVCYRHAICQRQKNGQCGWTIDSVLKACLDSYENN